MEMAVDSEVVECADALVDVDDATVVGGIRDVEGDDVEGQGVKVYGVKCKV